MNPLGIWGPTLCGSHPKKTGVVCLVTTPCFDGFQVTHIHILNLGDMRKETGLETIEI